jgi:hypothetical protein
MEEGDDGRAEGTRRVDPAPCTMDPREEDSGGRTGGRGCLLHVARSRYRPLQAELGFQLGVRGGSVQMRRAVGAGWGGGGGGHGWILHGQGRGACGWMA